MPDPPIRLPDPDARRVDTAHQLPPHRGKVSRVADHLAALSVDAREWVELRIDLVKAEITEKKDAVVESVERKAIGAAFLAVAGVVALYALGFLLAALAVGLGWALANGDGSDVLRPLFFGLGIVTLLLFAVAGVLAILGKGRLDAASAIDARLKAPTITESDASTPGRPTRHQIQDLEAAHARLTTT